MFMYLTVDTYLDEKNYLETFSCVIVAEKNLTSKVHIGTSGKPSTL